MSHKAIKFNLLPLNDIKKQNLIEMSNEFKDIYNFAAIRMPSLHSVNQTVSRSAMEGIRKDLKSNTTLHSQIVQEAIEYSRSNYLTSITNNGDNTKPSIPHLTKNIIRIHNRAWKFENINGTYYVAIPYKKQNHRFSKIYLPMKNSEYYNFFLNEYSKFGVGQIDVDNEIFITTIKIESKKTGSYKPETFIGIDLGLNNLATLVVIDNNNKVLFTKLWNGKETRHIRNRFHNYRKKVSKIKRLDLVKRTKGYESNWMENINHNISKEIIEIANRYPKPIIKMEELHKFTNLRWNFFQTRTMIEYKAKNNNIKFGMVDSKYTSQKCNKCNHTEKSNRNKLNFKCKSCGYSSHSDFNAAVNIAKSPLKPQNPKKKVVITGQNENEAKTTA